MNTTLKPPTHASSLVQPIVIWPDPILAARAVPVQRFSSAELGWIIDSMIATMLDARGIGLAANQIGLPLDLAVLQREDGVIHEIINPVISDGHEPVEYDEGCLSIPGERERVQRWKSLTLIWQDRHGAEHKERLFGHDAHVAQHEVGHLRGKVYADLLPPDRYKVLLKRWTKRKRHAAEAAE